MDRIVAVIAAVLLVLSVSPVAGATQPPPTSRGTALPTAGSFGIPERVLQGGGSGIDMAVAEDGRVHLVAADGGAVWYATDRTGDWTVRQVLGDFAEGGTWIWPSIVLDGNGRVHIVAQRVLCHPCGPEGQRWSYGLHYLTDAGRERGTFAESPERLTWSGTSPSLAAHGTKVMLAYQGTPRSGAGPLKLLAKSDGTWTESTIARNASSPSLSLAIGPHGRPRVAYLTEHGLRYARARTASGGWVVERVTTVPWHDDWPSLAIDAQGGAHVTTIDWEDRAIHYMRRTEDGWSEPVVVGQGHAHALAVQRPAKPWVLVGGRAAVRAFRPVEGDFTPERVSAMGVADELSVAVAVLPSGSVVTAWYGAEHPDEDTYAVWVSRT